jgi:hypothetical protein
MTTDTLVLAPAASPWRTVWFSPRRTIRAIVDATERPSIVPVVALACITSALGGLEPDETGAISAAASTMPVIVGGLRLVFGVIIGPFILAFVGSMLGGEADPTDLRPAVAWSYVPTVASLVFLILVLMSLPGAAQMAAGEFSSTAIFAVVGVIGIFACALWSIVLLVAMVAEVQRFSVLKAIANVALPAAPILLLLL